jgi:hypothetical protein
MRKVLTLTGSAVFLVIAPGFVAGLVEYGGIVRLLFPEMDSAFDAEEIEWARRFRLANNFFTPYGCGSDGCATVWTMISTLSLTRSISVLGFFMPHLT